MDILSSQFVVRLRFMVVALFLLFLQMKTAAQPTSVATAVPCDRAFQLKFPIWRIDANDDDAEVNKLVIKVDDGTDFDTLYRISNALGNSASFPDPAPWESNDFDYWDTNEYFFENMTNWAYSKGFYGGYPLD